MKNYYEGIAKRMLSELKSISDSMTHPGEKGRNNELVLKTFLQDHLPQKYSLTTGKVVSANGKESSQTDIIIQDRLNSPAFIDARAFSIVPIESTYGIISVKTTIDKSELEDATAQVASVRALPQIGNFNYHLGMKIKAEPQQILTPRGFIFAFKSTWKSIDSVAGAFTEIITPIEDGLRPNCLCILDQVLIVRKPQTTEIIVRDQYPFLHFFIFLLRALDTFHMWRVDFDEYFEHYPM